VLIISVGTAACDGFSFCTCYGFGSCTSVGCLCIRRMLVQPNSYLYLASPFARRERSDIKKYNNRFITPCALCAHLVTPTITMLVCCCYLLFKGRKVRPIPLCAKIRPIISSVAYTRQDNRAQGKTITNNYKQPLYS
jgi:hypothetical protein